MHQSQFNPFPGPPTLGTIRVAATPSRRQMFWLISAFLCGMVFGAYLVARDYKLAGVLVLGHTLLSFALFFPVNFARDRRSGAAGQRLRLLVLTALSFAGGSAAGAQLAAGRLHWLASAAWGGWTDLTPPFLLCLH
jgi:FtsH-binding integral membrane protein